MKRNATHAKLTLPDKHGFSLVELSIVLVILGLLTGGILAGQSLIRAAELRKVTSDYSVYKAATQSFRDRYIALPGDMTNATSFWGSAADCWAATTGKLTCNGNGNGSIANVAAASDTSNVEWEPYHFWLHLANADLIAGSYSGSSVSTCSIANVCPQPNVNVPSGPFNSGWMLTSVATATSGRLWSGRATNQDRNILALVNPSNHNSRWWYGASLSAQQQWSIDIKIDDGKPYTGLLVDMSGTNNTYTPNCASANSDEFGSAPPGTTTNSAEYNITAADVVSTSQGCIPLFDLE